MQLSVIWERYCRSRCLAQSTLVNMTVALHHFQGHFGDRPLDSIGTVDLGEFSVKLAKGRAAPTVNKVRREVRAVWRFAVNQGYATSLPDWERLKEPRRAPMAFTVEEFKVILGTAKAWPGWICGVPAGAWWESLLTTIWYTGGRVGAVLALGWPEIDFERGTVKLLAENQKQAADQVFIVGQDCLEALKRAREPERAKVWPWQWRREVLYRHFRRMAALAGVPLDHTAGPCFHRIRRSTASYIQAAGGDATGQLGHSCSSVTKRYLDPRICGEHDSRRFMPPL